MTIPVPARHLVVLSMAALLAGGCLKQDPPIPDNVHVVDESARGEGDGRTWSSAFTDLQSALDAAVAGDQIWVAAGIYRPGRQTDPENPRTATFAMVEGVSIYGGFAGTETALDQRDWAANETILSGDINESGDHEGNAYTVVTGASDARLDGFIITGGNANGSGGDAVGPHRNGGGMYNLSVSALIVENCVFTANLAFGDGGGMLNAVVSNAAVIHCSFVGNEAGDGGGMFNTWVSDSAVRSCTFSANQATWGGGMHNSYCNSGLFITGCAFEGNSTTLGGSGMYNYTGNPDIADSTFTGNETSGEGGGMYNSTTSATVTNCAFIGNQAFWHGGAMYNSMGGPTVSDCHFTENHAMAGGGMYNYSGNPTIRNCIFNRNTASRRGGGMRSWTTKSRIANCTFTDNTAEWGGGLHTRDATSDLTVTNCTFAGNYASDSGGGMHNEGSSPVVFNCIMWGNYAAQAESLFNDALSEPLITHSCIEGDIAGAGIIDEDPRLANAPLRVWLAYGTGANSTLSSLNAAERYSVEDIIEIAFDGIARTVTGVSEFNVSFAPSMDVPVSGYTSVRNWGPGATDLTLDVRLTPSSPCIDTGTNAPFEPGGGVEGVTTDLAGNPRIVGGIVDMGAYEYQPD